MIKRKFTSIVITSPIMAKVELQIRYNDLFFRIIISLVAAHLIVTFGASQSFFQLLISWIYYRSLVPSAFIAFLLVSEVYLATVKLDKRFDWKEKTAVRIGLQSIFGLVLPAVTAFLLAAVYFAAFGYNILANTYYLQFDFPVIVILLLMLNIYYLAFYFFRRWQALEIENTNASAEPAEKMKSVFIVNKGSRNVPVPMDNISYFFHDGDFNFLRTFSKEDFIINQPLDEVEQKMPKYFFRVNRQMIVNLRACEHFELLQYGRLEVMITPKPKEPVIVSQKRAKAFKEWIER